MQATAILSGTTYKAPELVYSVSGISALSVFMHTFPSLLSPDDDAHTRRFHY